LNLIRKLAELDGFFCGKFLLFGVRGTLRFLFASPPSQSKKLKMAFFRLNFRIHTHSGSKLPSFAFLPVVVRLKFLTPQNRHFLDAFSPMLRRGRKQKTAFGTAISRFA